MSTGDEVLQTLRDSHSAAMAQKVTFSEERKDVNEHAESAPAKQTSANL
jgi:hypothetical protein